MRLLIVAMLLAVALAGCSDGGSPDPIAPQDDLKATDDTGIIRGVVVDDAVVPLAGVTVQVADRSTVSDADGAFGFDGLEPGAHTVTVSKFGFTPVTTPVQVEAGVDDVPAVRIQLSAIPGFNPFSHTIIHEGLYQCGTSVLVVCGAPGIILGFAGQPDPLNLDTSTHTFYFGEGTQYVQTEMIWDSTQAASTELYFEQEGLDEGCTQYTDEEALAGAYGMGSAEGDSPIRSRIPADILKEHNVNPDDCGIYHSVFAGGAQGTAVGFSLQQPFTWYLTEFHGFDPDEDWWYVDDGEHPLPS